MMRQKENDDGGFEGEGIKETGKEAFLGILAFFPSFLPLLLSLAPCPLPNIPFHIQVLPIPPLHSIPYSLLLPSLFPCIFPLIPSWHEIACSEGGESGESEEVRGRTSTISPCY